MIFYSSNKCGLKKIRIWHHVDLKITIFLSVLLLSCVWVGVYLSCQHKMLCISSSMAVFFHLLYRFICEEHLLYLKFCLYQAGIPKFSEEFCLQYLL